MRKIKWMIYLRPRMNANMHYEGVSKSSRTESITKYMPTTINTRWEATQRIMATKPTMLTHKIAIQLHLVAKNCTICSSHSRLPVRRLLDTQSYSWDKVLVIYDHCDACNVLTFRIHLSMLVARKKTCVQNAPPPPPPTKNITSIKKYIDPLKQAI
jgi:hypothetical protein